MFLAPKEIKNETGESLLYCPKRVLVSKEFTFDAAHHLFNYEGKCKALHGHTYHLQVAVSAFLDERGMTYDFRDLKRIYQEYLEPKLDRFRNLWSNFSRRRQGHRSKNYVCSYRRL